MKMKDSLISLLPIFLVFWSVSMAAQSKDLPPPQMQSGVGIPPPPGLPIDFGIPGVMAGGVLIGIYFLRNRNVTSPNR